MSVIDCHSSAGRDQAKAGSPGDEGVIVEIRECAVRLRKFRVVVVDHERLHLGERKGLRITGANSRSQITTLVSRVIQLERDDRRVEPACSSRAAPRPSWVRRSALRASAACWRASRRRCHQGRCRAATMTRRAAGSGHKTRGSEARIAVDHGRALRVHRGRSFEEA